MILLTHTRRFEPGRILIAALALLASVSVATGQQIAGWLPMADMPLTAYELGGFSVAPNITSISEWDLDGPGPLPSQLVVSGVIFPVFTGGRYMARFTGGSWLGMNSDEFSTYPRSICKYQGPLDSIPQLYAAASSDQGIRRYMNNAWTSIATINDPFNMCTGDLDGPAGPQPERLFIASRYGVYQWNGTQLQQIYTNLYSAPSSAVIVWDADGSGPELPRLYAGTMLNNVFSLLVWSGTSWSAVATFDSYITGLTDFDFDGDGPEPSSLVISGAFTRVNNDLNAAGIVRYRDGVFSLIGDGTMTGNWVQRTCSYDIDGPGPAQPWLVAGGRFSTLGGTAANHIAAFYDNAWHPLPEHLTSSVTALSVAHHLPYSNSPQLLVGCISRRCVSRFALCDDPSAIEGDAPSRIRTPEGQSATFDVIPSGDELTFRWYKGDTALVDGATAHGSTISGVYGPRLTITNVRPQDIGQYHAVVFNPLGQARSRDVDLSIGCRADFNLDDSVDVMDYLDFVSAFATSDPDADFNADRVIDFFDYLDFVNQFATGC